MIKKIITVALVVSISGCATSAHDRRMADADGDSDTGKYVAAGLGLLAIGAVAYAAGRDTGAGAAYAPMQVADYDWAWDLQRGSNGGTVWVCRGRQSGQYSDQNRCAYKYQSDNTWPGLF